MRSVAIVAASYEHLATTTGPCLEALLRFTDVPFRSIWVDDGSRDGTPQHLVALAARDRRVDVVLHEHNRGWAEATRTGLRRIGEEATHVCLLNSDVLVTPRWLSRLLGHLEGGWTPTAVIPNEFPEMHGTPRQWSPEPPIVPGTRVAAPPPPLERVLELAGRVAERFAGQSRPAAPSGFCLLVRRREVPLLDAFLRDFDRYHSGELDWRQPWEAYGATCRVALDVFVFHARGGSGGYYRYDRERAL